MTAQIFAKFTKDPDAELTYQFDWSDWLATAVTISSYVITADAGITVESDSNTDTAVNVKLSGGTVGESYDIACLMTDSSGEIDERTITIEVEER